MSTTDQMEKTKEVTPQAPTEGTQVEAEVAPSKQVPVESVKEEESKPAEKVVEEVSSDKESSLEKEKEQRRRRSASAEVEMTETQKLTRKEQKKKRKAEKKQHKIQKRKNKKPRIRIFPIWLRLIIVVALSIAALTAGLMFGYGGLGDGEPRDALEWETWQHIIDIVFKER
ncbi:DNA-directed RNA polymerase subunit beta [Paucisalibacillus globulus]|uniref:DNA-directed RNA polymerase subunit beta n=1 Tax=Paucisalibacillus globulus TaxID=351095 RepID=UPI0004053F49|nr:DNA-directed RNA polymerase subunit beta [Paucisalibacillus globulus]